MARSSSTTRTRLLAACALALWPAWASAVDESALTAGRSAVTGQIEAFRREDAGAAYGYAAPGIRTIFGSQDAFMAMVRQAYRPVYRPRSYSFGTARDTEAGFEQAVAIQDEAGADWDAVYSFEQQPDGSWKISGCRLVKRPGEAV